MLDFKFSISWDYKGQRGTSNLWHEGFSRDIRDWTTAFARIAEEVLAPYVEDQFESQGGEGAGKWADLAESTIKDRAHHGYGPTPILTRSGDLKWSFRTQRLTPLSFAWGSMSPYAMFHQTGTGKGFNQRQVESGKGTGRGMPQRPIFDFTGTDRASAAMQRILIREGAKAARRVGFAIGASTAGAALNLGDLVS